MKKRSLVLLVVLAGLGGCAPKAPSGMKLTSPPPKPPAAPLRVDQPLDAELRRTAQAEIDAAMQSDIPLIRAHGIEAIRYTAGTSASDQILKSLADPNPMVRFASAMACGDLKVREAHEKLLRMRNDPVRSVNVAVRYALHRIGDKRFSRDLELLAADPDRNVRGNTVMVLGMLGEKSALKILSSMQRDSQASVRLQVAEAMWRLGDKGGLEQLVACTVSQFPDDQIIAFIALAGPRDRRVIEHIRGGLTADHTEVALVAARAMGILGSDEGYGVALIGAKSVDPRQRALAALALGAIGRSDAQGVLGLLLKDGNADVRLSSATAMLQLRDEEKMVK